MRRYHHIGIPTSTPRPGETYLPEHRCYFSGFETSAFGIEWMRYEPECALPELVKTVAHVAFEVDDLEKELAGRKILIPPNSPSPGVVVAFVEEDGAPVELLCFEKPVQPKTRRRRGARG
jgi:hypothetical protein